MTEYSGRTTDFNHLWAEKNAEEEGVSLSEWLKKHTGEGEECLQSKTVFEVTWTNCPVEVREEVQKLWEDFQFGNDHFYYNWNKEFGPEDYPIIAECLDEEILQHFRSMTEELRAAR